MGGKSPAKNEVHHVRFEIPGPKDQKEFDSFREDLHKLLQKYGVTVVTHTKESTERQSRTV